MPINTAISLRYTDQQCARENTQVCTKHTECTANAQNLYCHCAQATAYRAGLGPLFVNSAIVFRVTGQLTLNLTLSADHTVRSDHRVPNPNRPMSLVV